MKPYGLSVNERAASTRCCDHGRDETWAACPFLLLLSPFICFSSSSPSVISSAPPPSSPCHLPVPPALPLLSSHFSSSPHMYVLPICSPWASVFFQSPLNFSCLGLFVIAASPQCFLSSRLLSCPLASSPCPQLPNEALLFSLFPPSLAIRLSSVKQSNFHIFLRCPERRPWPDLNLHVREGI